MNKKNIIPALLLLILSLALLFACDNSQNNNNAIYQTDASGARITDASGEDVTIAPLSVYIEQRNDKGETLTDKSGKILTTLLEIPNTFEAETSLVDVTGDAGEVITDEEGAAVTYNVTEPTDVVIVDITNKKGENITEPGGQKVTVTVPRAQQPVTVFIPVTNEKGDDVTGSDGSKALEPIPANPDSFPVRKITTRFAKTYGGSLNDYFSDCIALNDGNFLALNVSVSYDKDLSESAKLFKTPVSTIIKYDTRGNIIWQKAFGGNAGLTLESLCETPEGDITAVGYSKSTNLASENHGDYDAVLLKLDSSGNQIYLKTFGGSLTDSYTSHTVTGGYIYAAGFSFSKDGTPGKSDNSGCAVFTKYKLADGEMIFTKTFGSGGDRIEKIVPDKSGNIYCAGILSEQSNLFTTRGKTDSFVLKLDANGNQLFKTQLGGSKTDNFTAVTPALDGGCVVAGRSESDDGDFSLQSNRGGADAFIIKLSDSGKIDWINECRGFYDDELTDIITTDNDYIAVGYSRSKNRNMSPCGNRGGSDAIIVNFDSSGNIKRIQSFGGSYDDSFRAVCCSQGIIFAAGSSLSDNTDLYSLTPSSNTQFAIGLVAAFNN